MTAQLITVAGPGFPIGCGPVRGGMDPKRGHFLAKNYAKIKKMGPVGGLRLAGSPRSANRLCRSFENVLVYSPVAQIAYIVITCVRCFVT